MDESPKICPVLSTVQIVPLGFEAMIVPHAEVQGGPQLNPQLNLTAVKEAAKTALLTSGRTLTLYRAEGGFRFRMAKDVKQDPENPKFIFEKLAVDCVREKCQWWDETRRDCGAKHPETAITTLAAAALSREYLARAQLESMEAARASRPPDSGSEP